MEAPIFYHPETGKRIEATRRVVACQTEYCIGFEEVLELWDLGTGIICGGCSAELVPATEGGMVEIETPEEEEDPGPESELP